MGTRIDKNLYRIRTLSFYQKEGGVYNELITVLTKLREDSRIRLNMAPVKILNEACLLRDELKDLRSHEFQSAFDKSWETWGREGFIEQQVIFSIIFVLNDYLRDSKPDLLLELELKLVHDTTIFPLFEAITVNHVNFLKTVNIRQLEEKVLDMQKQLSDKDMELILLREQNNDDAAIHFQKENEALKEKYDLLARESRQKELDFKAQIADLEELCKNKDYELNRLSVKQNSEPATDADKMLNFDNIMAYIESRGSYDYCDQIFKMIDKLVRRIVTDEQLSKIDTLEAKMIAMSKGLTINNDIHDNTGDIMPGTVNMNK